MTSVRLRFVLILNFLLRPTRKDGGLEKLRDAQLSFPLLEVIHNRCITQTRCRNEVSADHNDQC